MFNFKRVVLVCLLGLGGVLVLSYYVGDKSAVNSTQQASSTPVVKPIPGPFIPGTGHHDYHKDLTWRLKLGSADIEYVDAMVALRSYLDCMTEADSLVFDSTGETDIKATIAIGEQSMSCYKWHHDYMKLSHNIPGE